MICFRSALRKLWLFIVVPAAFFVGYHLVDEYAESYAASDSIGHAEHSDLIVSDPATLKILELRGGGFASQLAGALVQQDDAQSLSSNELYAALVAQLSADIAGQRRQFYSSGEVVARGVVLFKEKWLTMPISRFDFVGIINRLDRTITNQDSCGEVRFIYRLRYSYVQESETVFSPLPMTVTLNYKVPRAANDQGCSLAAKSLLIPPDVSAESRAAHLLSQGSAYRPIFSLERPFEVMEVNIHIGHLRENAKSNLTDQGLYLLRSFTADRAAKRLTAKLLENTPDVERLQREPVLKEKLRSWLRSTENLNLVDYGTFHVPGEFLATKAISVSPFGLVRRSNLLFSEIFSEKDFADLNLASYRYIKSTSALLRRLDTLTCVGCHQSRSTAGFHFLGMEKTPGSEFNAVAVPFSAHFSEVLPWRRGFVSSLLRGSGASRYIPPAERGFEGSGGYGSHCGMAGGDFGTWSCESGLRCYGDFPLSARNEVGQCFPENLGGVYSPCERSELSSGFDSRFDRLLSVKRDRCSPGHCMPLAPNGFPNGLCAEYCGKTERPEICLTIPDVGPFADCRRTRSFKVCHAESFSRNYALKRCDAESPCPDDYICAEANDSAEAPKRPGMGACVPSYLLIQLGLDHHP